MEESSDAVVISGFEEVIQRYRVIIFDVDGTLLNGSSPIEGVAESMYRLLTDSSKKVLFYSNGGYCTSVATW